jgi:hypothetical protein
MYHTHFQYLNSSITYKATSLQSMTLLKIMYGLWILHHIKLYLYNSQKSSMYPIKKRFDLSN